MQAEFGQHLKDWRGRRRMSQLDLALCADVSARHLAFLETGRSRPSRAMVLKLGDALDMPLDARNLLLHSAGYRAAFDARPFDSVAMEPVQAAIRHMIDQHDPYPALVIDRHWTVLQGNRSAGALLDHLGLGPGGSLLSEMTEPGRGAALIENWGEVAAHLVSRLRTESAHLGGDAVLDAAAGRLLVDPALATATEAAGSSPVLPVRLRMGGHVLSMFSTLTQFGTACDIALSDIRIEMFFPADAATDQMLRAAGQQS